MTTLEAVRDAAVLAPTTSDADDDLSERGVRQTTVAWLLVFFPVFAVFFATATFNVERLSPDPVAAALSAHSLVDDGDLTIQHTPVQNPWIVEAGGRRVSNRQPGVIAFGVPFYALSTADGFSMVPAAAAGAFSAAAFVATLFLLFRRLVPSRPALTGALVAGFATSTWAVSADSLWTHGPNQLFLVVAMLFLVRRSWAVSGVALALAILMRTHLAVVALLMGVWMTWRERSLRPMIAIGIPSALGLFAVLAYTRFVFGVWDLSGGYSAFDSYPVGRLIGAPSTPAFGPNLLGSLLALQRGVFVISPFLLLVLPGLRRAIRIAPSWVNVSAAAAVLYFAIQLRINLFDGGSRFWGYRLALEPLVLLAPLLLLAYREWTARTRLRRRLFTALVVLSVGYQAIGAVLFTAPAEGMRPWLDNWITSVLTGQYAPQGWTLVGVTIVATALVLVQSAHRHHATPSIQ